MKSFRTVRRIAVVTAILCFAFTIHASAQTGPVSASVGAGRGSISPNYNGKMLKIGQFYTVKAVPASGCGFSNWVIFNGTNTTTSTNAKLVFTMPQILQLTANFYDKLAPALAITTKSGTTSNSVFSILGTSKDNIGVAAVYVTVGAGAPFLAATANGFSNWQATVVLGKGQNSIQVYAVDAGGNHSKTAVVSINNIATGFAPETITGTALYLTTTGASAEFAFGDDTYSQVGTGGADSGLGTYNFALAGPNTGILTSTLNALSGGGTDSNQFTFVFATNNGGTWSNNDGNIGTFTLAPISASAPGAIYGLALSGTDTGSNAFTFTNQYEVETFSGANSTGQTGGSYYYQQYSPDAGLITASNRDGSTTSTMLRFSSVAESNLYLAATVDNTNGVTIHSGVFVVSGESISFVGPTSLAGFSTAVTEVKSNNKRRSFTIGFTSTYYGQFSTDTNQDSSVGTYTFVRTGPKSAQFLDMPTVPPDQLSNNANITFNFTSAKAATFSNDEGHGTITFSAITRVVPPSIVGKKLTGSSHGHSGGYQFGYQTFQGIGGSAGESGTYTYYICGPQAALVILQETIGENAGTTHYLGLWFNNANGGSYRDGHGAISTGTFTMK